MEELERQVAVLRGKPDPGLSCGCAGGSVKVWDKPWEQGGSWGWGKCPKCNGKGRVFP